MLHILNHLDPLSGERKREGGKRKKERGWEEKERKRVIRDIYILSYKFIVLLLNVIQYLILAFEYLLTKRTSINLLHLRIIHKKNINE